MNDSVHAADLAIASDPQASLALEIIERLRSAGQTAYLAGGCVRDALLGIVPKDYDVATDARPEQIRQLFGHRRTLAIGAAFGVISVLGKKRAGLQPVEVATFRSDGPYADGRRPTSVHYSTPEEDASRRDFTINGLFYDPVGHEVIDFVGGREDLEAGRVRAIGDPHARFAEDKLRLLRAVRFAAVYRFEIESRTWQAVLDHAGEVTVCSGERIGAEMRRLLRCEAAARGVALLRDCGLAAAIMPRVAAAIVADDILEELQRRLDAFEQPHFPARLAAVALSCGESAEEALAELASAWKLSTAEAEGARAALRHREDLLRADQLRWSQLQPLLVDRHAAAGVSLARALARASGSAEEAMARIDASLELPPDQLDPPPLLTGDDLKRMGLRPGPGFRGLLERLRTAQLDGEIASTEQAQQWVRQQPEAEGHLP